MANNFELVLVRDQSIVSGDAEAFCAGTGSITLARTGGYNNGIRIESSIWNKVATIKWDELIQSNGALQYFTYTGSSGDLSASVSWNGNRLTITDLTLSSSIVALYIGTTSTENNTYSNLEILDANGNSLLESSEPSTGLPLYIGDSNIQVVKLGDVNISKMYIGDTLIYGT